MDHGYPGNRGWAKRPPWDADGDSAGGDNKRRWSIEQITRLLREHPEYRLQDDPWTWQLIQMVMADPDDPDAQEMLTERIREHQMAYLGSGDAFWGNYWTPGSLAYPPNFLRVGQVPSGDAIGLVASQLPGNFGILGPTRSGKTNLLAHLFISNPDLLQAACIIAFVKKPELRHLVPRFISLTTKLPLPRRPVACRCKSICRVWPSTHCDSP